MKSPVKTKAAGAGTEQAPDANAEILRPVAEAPIAFNSESGHEDSTPPDIIVE